MVSFEGWRKSPSSKSVGSFIQAATPIIDRTLKGFGADHPALRAHAKVLVAKSLVSYEPNSNVPIKNWIYTQLKPLRRAKAQQEYVSTPERVRRQLFHLKTAEQELQEKLGRMPSDLELADHTKLSVGRLKKIRDYDVNVVPTAAFTDEEGTSNLPGTSKPDVRNVWLDYIAMDLDPVDRVIFEGARNKQNKAMLAKRLKISPAAVTQRAAKIMQRVSATFNEAGV